MSSEHEGYTVAQAAKRLGKSKRTVERYIAAGQLQVTHVDGKFGQERRIWHIPAELLKEGQEGGQTGQLAPPGAKIPEDQRHGGQVVIDTRVVRIHWGVYIAIAVCLGLAIASLAVALHALDVAYWLGGG